MQNLILEGLGKALIFLLVFVLAKTIYTDALEVDTHRLLGVPIWKSISTILFWIVGIVFGSLVLCGLINFGKPDVTLTTFLFAIMAGAGVYGLYNNKKEAK